MRSDVEAYKQEIQLAEELARQYPQYGAGTVRSTHVGLFVEAPDGTDLTTEQRRQSESAPTELLAQRVPVLLAQLERLCRFEAVAAELGSFDEVFLLQVSNFVEPLLRKLLLRDHLDIVDSIAAALVKKPRGLEVLECFRSGWRPTLVVMEWWLVGLRRALLDDEPTVQAWVSDVFQPAVSRFPGEHLSVSEHLRDKTFCQAIQQLRVRRNPLAHGDEFGLINKDVYRRWCLEAYRRPSLIDWMRDGVDETSTGETELGWVSFILRASSPVRAG